jgi:hypothetical protein
MFVSSAVDCGFELRSDQINDYKISLVVLFWYLKSTISYTIYIQWNDDDVRFLLDQHT